MGLDDADEGGHVEHLWRLIGVRYGLGIGSTCTYACDLCDGLLVVEPGAVHPPTV